MIAHLVRLPLWTSCLVLLGLGLGACGSEDYLSRLEEPPPDEPQFDLNAVSFSFAVEHDEDRMIVIGTEGATIGRAEVVAVNNRTGTEDITNASLGGAFVIELSDGVREDDVSLFARVGELESEADNLALESGIIGPPTASRIDLTRLAADEVEVSVSYLFGAPLQLVVANLTTGDVASVAMDLPQAQRRAGEVTIPAVRNQELVIYAVTGFDTPTPDDNVAGIFVRRFAP